MKNLLNFIGSTCTFKTKKWGNLTVESVSFTNAIDGDLVVYIGNPISDLIPLVRIHSECVFSEVFGSEFCDCADQFIVAMNKLKENKNGILFYLRIDGRGAGLSAKVKATDLETKGMDTFDSRVAIGVNPDSRDYSFIARFLKSKGIKSIRLLTNNPEKAESIRNEEIEVITEPLIINSDNINIRKLYYTKAKKFHHLIPEHYTKQDPFIQLKFNFDDDSK